MIANKEIKYIFNNQGNNSLVYDSYIIPFCRNNKDDSVNYKCRHRNDKNEPCPASFTVYENQIIRGVYNHHHKKLSEVVIQSKIAQYEEKILASTTRQPLAQIHSEIQSKLVKELTVDQQEEETERILDEIAEVFPEFDEVKSGLRKRRNKNQQQLPQAAEEIELEGDDTKTNAGQKFLLYDNKKKKKNRIMIFCSSSGLKLLCRSLFWHCDGTFHCAAKYFTQLYILHGWLEHRMIAAAFILMKRRRSKEYNEILKVLLKEAVKLGLVLNPTVIYEFFKKK